MQSETPRTDALVHKIVEGDGVSWSHHDITNLVRHAEVLERELVAAKNSLTLLSEKNAIHREMAKGNYWAWQGDGEDHLESLVCPVGISARSLLDIINERDVLKLKCAKMQSALERAETWFSRPRNDIMLDLIREALK